MKAISYKRFSHDGQSQHSIERQEMLMSSWARQYNVEVVDGFTDEGYSARTFDRPDVKQLFAFIKRNYRSIDYLIVAELTRFSKNKAYRTAYIMPVFSHNLMKMSQEGLLHYDGKTLQVLSCGHHGSVIEPLIDLCEILERIRA